MQVIVSFGFEYAEKYRSIDFEDVQYEHAYKANVLLDSRMYTYKCYYLGHEHNQSAVRIVIRDQTGNHHMLQDVITSFTKVTTCTYTLFQRT